MKSPHSQRGNRGGAQRVRRGGKSGPQKNDGQKRTTLPETRRGSGRGSKQVEGTLIIISRGGGIVKNEEYPDGIRIYESGLNTALHGDEVKVKVLGAQRGELAGVITTILLRAKTQFTGVLVERDGKKYLKASDPKMYAPILIPAENLNGTEVGDRVYGTITEWKDSKSSPIGKILKKLGKPGDHETEMQAIALERGFTEDFPEQVLEEAHAIDKRGIRPEDLKDRRDFRKVSVFTIDPYDAKDFDDAISVERLPSGDVEVGIHIADVSHYVQQKTDLDTEALERGTSVYLVDRTIPMLPRVLSDDLCSLLPNVDRLTMSCVVTFGPNGEEKDAWYGPTVIHSAYRFTYEEAQEVLDGKEHPHKADLELAASIARRLGKGRVDKGALVLEQEEIKVLIDKEGKPTQIVKKVRTESHTLIEELMLLANRRIAEFLERGGKARKPGVGKDDGYAVLYRVHDRPSEEKAEDLAFFMRSVGYPLPVGKNGIEPKTLSAVVKNLEENDLKQTILTFIIRSMAKAIYSTKNLGHYGLQFEHYVHFTSPIRRYPDLVIHRLLRYALAGKPAPAGLRKAYERIARLTSMAEMRAADAERESVKFKLTEYMAARIGQTVTGVITGVTDWGMYVRDKETTAEGLVSLRTLGDEPFRIDPRLATITGEISKRSFRIGDTIMVKIVRADPERRQIDYEVVSQS